MTDSHFCLRFRLSVKSHIRIYYSMCNEALKSCRVWCTYWIKLVSVQKDHIWVHGCVKLSHGLTEQYTHEKCTSNISPHAATCSIQGFLVNLYLFLTQQCVLVWSQQHVGNKQLWSEFNHRKTKLLSIDLNSWAEISQRLKMSWLRGSFWTFFLHKPVF